MFIGRFYYTVEAKGRVSLPKSLRLAGQRQTGSDHPDWIVTRGFEGGLMVFLATDFEQRLAELANRTFTKKRDRDFLRLMTNDAQLLQTDQQGRVMLPDHLKELAGIEKDVVIVGSYHYLEIWDVTAYHSYIDQISAQAADLAETIETNHDAS